MRYVIIALVFGCGLTTNKFFLENIYFTFVTIEAQLFRFSISQTRVDVLHHNLVSSFCLTYNPQNCGYHCDIYIYISSLSVFGI